MSNPDPTLSPYRNKSKDVRDSLSVQWFQSRRCCWITVAAGPLAGPQLARGGKRPVYVKRPKTLTNLCSVLQIVNEKQKQKPRGPRRLGGPKKPCRHATPVSTRWPCKSHTLVVSQVNTHPIKHPFGLQAGHRRRRRQSCPRTTCRLHLRSRPRPRWQRPYSHTSVRTLSVC